MTRPTTFDPTEREAWLIAHRTTGLGNLRLAQLYEHFGSMHAALDASRAALRNAGLPEAVCIELAQGSRSLITSDLDWLAATPQRRNPAAPEN